MDAIYRFNRWYDDQSFFLRLILAFVWLIWPLTLVLVTNHWWVIVFWVVWAFVATIPRFVWFHSKRMVQIRAKNDP